MSATRPVMAPVYDVVQLMQERTPRKARYYASRCDLCGEEAKEVGEYVYAFGWRICLNCAFLCETVGEIGTSC